MFLRANNAIYSWTSTETKIDNLLTTPAGNPWNIVAIDYEEKRERKIVYSNRRSGRPRGRTGGKYSVEGFTLKMLRAQAFELKQYLATKAGSRSFGDVEFGIIVQVYEPLTPGAAPITINASDCTWDDAKNAHEEGIDELVTEIMIGCLQLTENGLSLFSDVASLNA